jgi:hypothetical protein
MTVENTVTTLHRKCTENSKHIFPEMKFRGLVPNSYIHVSVSDLYIPTIGPSLLLQQNRWTKKSWEYINKDGPQRMFMNERCTMYECIYCIMKNKCKKSGIRPPNL